MNKMTNPQNFEPENAAKNLPEKNPGNSKQFLQVTVEWTCPDFKVRPPHLPCGLEQNKIYIFWSKLRLAEKTMCRYQGYGVISCWGYSCSLHRQSSYWVKAVLVNSCSSLSNNQMSCTCTRSKIGRKSKIFYPHNRY